MPEIDVANNKIKVKFKFLDHFACCGSSLSELEGPKSPQNSPKSKSKSTKDSTDSSDKSTDKTASSTASSTASTDSTAKT